MLENSMRLQLGCGVNTKLTLTQTVDDILKPEAILALQNETFNVENNTRRLDVEGMKEQLLRLRFIQEDLGLIPRAKARDIRSE